MRIRTLLMTIILASFLFLTPIFAQGEWERGKIVGLRAGTCIREGPGLSYRAHTRVPENDWAVKVTDGPRVADGHTWWDTSRNAAGDPSGGTGWVTQDQTDTACDTGGVPPPTANSAPTANPIPTANPNPTPSNPIPTPKLDSFYSLRSWWYQQSALFKWSVAVVAILLIPTLWRLIGGVVIQFIGAVLLAIVIWIVLDLTRSGWEATWLKVAGPIFGRDIPDLALLLSVVPLVSQGISVIKRWIRRGS